MDKGAAREAQRLLGTLIGELMEDHVDLALNLRGADAIDRLASASRDIAALSRALEVISRIQANDEVAN